MPHIRKIVDAPKSKTKSLHPDIPQPPALLLLVMPCKCGKSTILSNLLLSKEFYGQEYFDVVKIISNTIDSDTTSRFLRQAYDTENTYNDRFIYDLVKSQKAYGTCEDMPSACLVIDDCLGEKTIALDNLASRRRHVNIGLMCVSTQLFRKVSPTIRANATNVCIGKLQNSKELEKLVEEYADMFDGSDNFVRLYKKAIGHAPYSFLHLNLQENPAEAWISFEKKIYPDGSNKVHNDVTEIKEENETTND
tara:strand:+ start:31 stop:780 length:750 start_codon:yes stop_codon:yes gene_type:complete